MSKAGAPTLTTDGRGRHVVIVAASWHDTIMDGLIAGAERTLDSACTARSSFPWAPSAPPPRPTRSWPSAP